MSNIASPRQSTTSISPDPSHRPSFDIPTRSRTTSPARPAARRNKAALRDYYNLRATGPVDASQDPHERQEPESQLETKASELDAQGFDPEAYVRDVLAKESLQRLLKIESGLVNEIRGLDGEKKALVYDNYSKLITATDTIRKMRTNMDPLIPTTSMLSPAISHIAETATSLATSLQSRSTQAEDIARQEDAAANKRKQRETVRWVLGAPSRLRSLVDEERRPEAEKDWEAVKGLLEKWKGVEGADEIKEQCLKIMDEGSSDDAG
ncbi:MAG: hypothetical protein Q9219_001496 [cf. Caloplaca sp. 3 TL-2023]